MPPTIADYYRAVIDSARQEIATTPDQKVLGMDAAAWVDYLVVKFGMTEIEADDTRAVQLHETETDRVARGYDIYTDRMPGARYTETTVRIDFPIVPSETLDEIWKHKLAPNPYSISRAYPLFEYDRRAGLFQSTVGPAPAEVKREIEAMKEAIQRYNDNIRSENQSLRPQIERLVESRRQHLKEKHRKLDDLASAVGIDLVKKADVAQVVPTVPRVRTRVAPIMPDVRKPAPRPVLEADKFKAVLELIDNQCRQFERTPQAFAQLTEEGLRDVILSSLNAVFEGAAGGETFQGDGKVDIHLRITQGEIFIAELKFWNGPASLAETVQQLRGRLTWRDAYGVALMLSRNANFAEVLQSMQITIPGLAGFVPNTLRQVSPNHSEAAFTIATDEAHCSRLHVLVYNLYIAQASRRIVKSRRP